MTKEISYKTNFLLILIPNIGDTEHIYIVLKMPQMFITRCEHHILFEIFHYHLLIIKN